MSTNRHSILAEALRLPEQDRAALAAELLESLEEEFDHDVEAAWREEVQRRIGELDSGEVQPISWDEARRQITGDDGDAAAD